MTEERDPTLSQRYRDLPADEPSREVDQAILAAAHRPVDKPHAPLVVPAGRHRWYFSLAAAAVLVLAIAVTLQVERQQPDAELAVTPAPAPQQKKVQPAPQAVPAPPEKPQEQLRQERRPAYAPDPRGDEARLAAEKANAQAEAKAAEADKERAASEVAAGRAAPSPRSSSAPMAAQYAATPLQRELEHIAELRRQGRDGEADKALAEFRKRYPGYVIPEAMRAKVERK